MVNLWKFVTEGQGRWNALMFLGLIAAVGLVVTQNDNALASLRQGLLLTNAEKERESIADKIPSLSDSGARSWGDDLHSEWISIFFAKVSAKSDAQFWHGRNPWIRGQFAASKR